MCLYHPVPIVRGDDEAHDVDDDDDDDDGNGDHAGHAGDRHFETP